MKKDLLFIIYSMEIGGDVRSLISLLRSIDYKKYSVDLVMLRNSGSLKDELPKEVHVLRPAINGDLWVARAIRGLRYFLKGYLFKSY